MNMVKLNPIRVILKLIFIGLLTINGLYALIILFLNPEAFFFGNKIDGSLAQLYSLVFLFVTIVVIWLLYKQVRNSELIALIYGILFFFNGSLNSISFNNGISPPVLYWIILLTSLVLFAVNSRKSMKQLENKEGKCDFWYAQHKSLILLFFFIGVLLCFTLFMIFNLINHEEETNNLLYLIEINADPSITNITLMIPVPSILSENSQNFNIFNGNFLYRMRNPQQSIIQTEHGKMLKITADSIEKKDEGNQVEQITMYRNFPLSHPINTSGSLDSEPLLFPKNHPVPFLCTDKHYRRNLIGNSIKNCTNYGSWIYAAFDSAPSSETKISVSLDGIRMISSPINPRRDGYQDNIVITINGSGRGWYNATGNLLT